MKAMATDIRNSADEEGDFETVALFEDYVAPSAKHLVPGFNTKIDQEYLSRSD